MTSVLVTVGLLLFLGAGFSSLAGPGSAASASPFATAGLPGAAAIPGSAASAGPAELAGPAGRVGPAGLVGSARIGAEQRNAQQAGKAAVARRISASDLRLASIHEASPVTWRAQLRRFLAERPASDPAVWTARLLHAGRLLRRFDLADAADAYRGILKSVPVHARPVRAQALFGLAQTDELRGRIGEAVSGLRRLRRDYRDLRQARFVAPAIRRLEQPPVRVGDRAPELLALDLTGRSQSLLMRRRRPALLCFLSFRDPEGWERTKALLEAWKKAGGGPEDALLMIVDPDSGALREWVEAEKITGPVIPARSGFLDPALLAYRIVALPAGCLIGPDGTVLLRNPRTRKLRNALRVVLGR